MIPREYSPLSLIKKDEMQLAHQVLWVASVGGLDVQNGYVYQMHTWINAYVLVLLHAACSAVPCSVQLAKPCNAECCVVQRATCQNVQCCAVQRATCETVQCCAVQVQCRSAVLLSI